MCRNDGIGQAQKTLSNDSGYFETIEVLPAYLVQDSMQCVLDLLCSKRAKKHHFHFRRDKKEIPSRGAYLAIKSETIECLDHAPVARVGLTFQPKERRPLRHQDGADLNVADWNVADLNVVGHERLLASGLLLLTASRFVYFLSKYCAKRLTFRIPIRFSWQYASQILEEN